jgi:hypothetical protein
MTHTDQIHLKARAIGATPGITQSRLRTHCSGADRGAYSGYNALYDPSRTQGAITAALCWAHARRQFLELADIAANARRGKNAPAISPIALEAVKRIDALFDIERTINGRSAEERLRVRQEQSAPLLGKHGCVRSDLACRVRPRSLSQSTTCSGVGIGLLASTRMEEFVSRTTRPSARCEDLHSGGSRGSLPAPSAAQIGPQQWPR